MTSDPPNSSTMPAELAAVKSVVASARRRIVTRARLEAASPGFLWGSVLAAAGLIATRALGLPAWLPWYAFIVLGPLLALALRRRRAPDDYRVAKLIDAQLGLKDRLAGGYDLFRRARAGRLETSPFTTLMLRDAAAAAAEAKRKFRGAGRPPAGWVAGVAVLVVAAGLSFWAIPTPGSSETQISAEQREQVRAFNESLSKMAESIRAMKGLDEEQEQAMLDALQSIRINEDELKKMSRADILRRLREANAKIHVPEGTQGAALKRAVADRMRAIAEMDQINKQLAEIDAINRREALIDLGQGRKAEAVNIKLKSSDLQIDQAIAEAAAKPGEAEKDYQQRLAAAEARERAEREKIKRFLAKTGEQVPESDVRKLAALMASDADFQGKVMAAIRDPHSTRFDAMRQLYRRQLEREFEKENIPRGLRQQLTTYLGK